MLYRTSGLKKSPYTAVFIFIVAMHACLATVLTGPLCKLQSEAGLRELAYSLGEVVRRRRRGETEG